MTFSFKNALFAVAGLLVVSSASQAAIITGELNISGSVNVSATAIDFQPMGTGNGTFGVDLFTQTGSFTPLAGGLGTVKDLDLTTQPVGSSFTLANFLTFAGAPGLHFDLTFIQPGAGSPASCLAAPTTPQSCTLPGSPFTLTNQSLTSSSANFNVRGTVTDGSSSPASTFVGTFSTQFPAQNFQQVLASLSSNGSISKSFAATFVVTQATPEPGTTALFLAGGMLLLAAVHFRSKLKA